jgi:hypothetical protein
VTSGAERLTLRRLATLARNQAPLDAGDLFDLGSGIESLLADLSTVDRELRAARRELVIAKAEMLAPQVLPRAVVPRDARR